MSIKIDTELFSDMMDQNAEFIPVLTIEDERLGQDEEVPEELPILPLRNSVLYPGVIIPITVGRDKSIRLIKEYYKKRKAIGVIAQTNADVEDPTLADLYKVGTAAQIIKTLQMPDGNTTVIIQGKRRFEVVEATQTEPYLKAAVVPYAVAEEIPKTRKFNALVQSVKELAIQVIGRSRNLPQEAGFAIKSIEDPVFLMNFVASNVEADMPTKQMLLEARTLNQMANDLLSVLTEEQQMMELKQARCASTWTSSSVSITSTSSCVPSKRSWEVLQTSRMSRN